MEAVVIVHPRFLRKEDLPGVYVLDELRAKVEYGSYDCYLKCLERLIGSSFRKVFLIDR